MYVIQMTILCVCTAAQLVHLTPSVVLVYVAKSLPVAGLGVVPLSPSQAVIGHAVFS
jgi:hypothetical protein